MTKPPPAECANCGAAIPRGARACPECGADERTGWRDSETSIYDGLDLPDEAWRDDDAPPGPAPRRRRVDRDVNGLPWYWWSVGIALALILVLGALALLR